MSQIPLPKPESENSFTKAKDELFSHCYQDIVEHLKRQIPSSFPFEKNKTCVFSSKFLNFTVIKSFLQMLSTWVTAKSNDSTRIDFLLLTSVTFSRTITMCSPFSPACGYDNSPIILIVDVYCPNTKCSGKLCLHKKTFQSLGRSVCLFLHCACVCQLRNIPSEDQTNSFFLSFGQGVYIFEESPKSIKMLLEMYIVLASFVPTERNASVLEVMLQLRDQIMLLENV